MPEDILDNAEEVVQPERTAEGWKAMFEAEHAHRMRLQQQISRMRQKWEEAMEDMLE